MQLNQNDVVLRKILIYGNGARSVSRKPDGRRGFIDTSSGCHVTRTVTYSY
jgi:hypothetical protein